MRPLTAAEETEFVVAEKRRRAWQHFQHRGVALDAQQNFLDALVAALPVPKTPRQVRFKIALRERQARVERVRHGVPPTIRLLARAHTSALNGLGITTE
ncbi:hypothetical protein GCM10027057_18900 [Marisediminicola antarctica]